MLTINLDTNHPKKSYTFAKNSAKSENVEENAKKNYISLVWTNYSSMPIVNSLTLRIKSYNAYSKSLLS